MGFDMKGLLNSQSTSGARRAPEVVRIPIDSIVPSVMNQYGIRDIELLAADIEENGLMHGPLVREMDDGTYEIISGERRYRACRLLYDGGNKAFASIPCTIADAADDTHAEYMLLAANATARELTDAEKSMQAARMLELLRKMRDEGHVFKGKMRDHVAALLDVSPAQVGRYQKIESGLSDELKAGFREGKIGVTDAYDLATAAPERQAEAARELAETGKVAKPQKEIGLGTALDGSDKNIAKSEREKERKIRADVWIEDHMNIVCDNYCVHADSCDQVDLDAQCAKCRVERLFRELLQKTC